MCRIFELETFLQPRPASNTEVLPLLTSKGFYGNEVQK